MQQEEAKQHEVGVQAPVEIDLNADEVIVPDQEYHDDDSDDEGSLIFPHRMMRIVSQARIIAGATFQMAQQAHGTFVAAIPVSHSHAVLEAPHVTKDTILQFKVDPCTGLWKKRTCSHITAGLPKLDLSDGCIEESSIDYSDDDSDDRSFQNLIEEDFVGEIARAEPFTYECGFEFPPQPMLAKTRLVKNKYENLRVKVSKKKRELKLQFKMNQQLLKAHRATEVDEIGERQLQILKKLVQAEKHKRQATTAYLVHQIAVQQRQSDIRYRDMTVKIGQTMQQLADSRAHTEGQLQRHMTASEKMYRQIVAISPLVIDKISSKVGSKTSDSTDMTCVICSGAFLHEEVSIWCEQCKHRTHVSCTQEWISKGSRGMQCPSCRFQIVSPLIEYNL